MNNDKIYGLTAPFFGLCSLSPLGERIRLEEPVPCGGIGSAIGEAVRPNPHRLLGEIQMWNPIRKTLAMRCCLRGCLQRLQSV